MPSEIRQTRDRERCERTREAILVAAKHVFATRGFHSTQVSEIVRSAHVGQGSFYRFFPDKRSCFTALLNDYMARLLAAFGDMEATPPTTISEYRQASAMAMIKLTESLLAERELTRMMLRDASTIDAEMTALVEGVYAQFAERARRYLQQALAGGYARTCEERWVPELILGMTQRLLSLWARGNIRDEDIPDALWAAVDFGFYGLAPRAAEATHGDLPPRPELHIVDDSTGT